MTDQKYRQVGFIIIVLGTILRMVTAILYPEVHWADEHYQTDLSEDVVFKYD